MNLYRNIETCSVRRVNVEFVNVGETRGYRCSELILPGTVLSVVNTRSNYPSENVSRSLSFWDCGSIDGTSEARHIRSLTIQSSRIHRGETGIVRGRGGMRRRRRKRREMTLPTVDLSSRWPRVINNSTVQNASSLCQEKQFLRSFFSLANSPLEKPHRLSISECPASVFILN